MACVIAQPCIGVKDTACITVCPVDVIHPTKEEEGFAAVEQLYIEPTHCIDCGLCAQECPVNAIFSGYRYAGGVDQLHREKNAAYFRDTPVGS